MHDARVTQPLILAIEPDLGKTSQLKSVARQVNAELLLVDSVDRALAAFSERIPDLILTPALLSARDDLALTERLRELGDAAAHIQTLTIPTLQSVEPPGAGMFATLRRDKPRVAGPDACEAGTFAEQVAVYLKGALEARRRHAPDAIPAEGAQSEATRQTPAAAASLKSPPTVDPLEAPAPAARRESPTASVNAPPPLEDFDLAAFMSEELLDVAQLPSVGSPSAVGGLATDLLQVEAMMSEAVEDFLPEQLSEAVPGALPASQELSDFVSEKAPWHFFNPQHARFAALLAKLDEIAVRRA